MGESGSNHPYIVSDEQRATVLNIRLFSETVIDYLELWIHVTGAVFGTSHDQHVRRWFSLIDQFEGLDRNAKIEQGSTVADERLKRVGFLTFQL